MLIRLCFKTILSSSVQFSLFVFEQSEWCIDITNLVWQTTRRSLSMIISSGNFHNHNIRWKKVDFFRIVRCSRATTQITVIIMADKSQHTTVVFTDSFIIHKRSYLTVLNGRLHSVRLAPISIIRTALRCLCLFALFLILKLLISKFNHPKDIDRSGKN